MTTLKDIQNTIAKQIKKAIGVEVEVTAMPDPSNWTISGPSADVIAAVIYLEDRKLMKMKNSVYDAELNETFAYMESK